LIGVPAVSMVTASMPGWCCLAAVNPTSAWAGERPVATVRTGPAVLGTRRLRCRIGAV
jgi:hypothetical protein